MTDRHVGYVVTLADSVREDDAEEGVLNAIRMVKGVLSVEPIVESTEITWARSSAIGELRKQLRDVLWPRVD